MDVALVIHDLIVLWHWKAENCAADGQFKHVLDFTTLNARKKLKRHYTSFEIRA